MDIPSDPRPHPNNPKGQDKTKTPKAPAPLPHMSTHVVRQKQKAIEQGERKCQIPLLFTWFLIPTRISRPKDFLWGIRIFFHTTTSKAYNANNIS